MLLIVFLIFLCQYQDNLMFYGGGEGWGGVSIHIVVKGFKPLHFLWTNSPSTSPKHSQRQFTDQFSVPHTPLKMSMDKLSSYSKIYYKIHAHAPHGKLSHLPNRYNLNIPTSKHLTWCQKPMGVGVEQGLLYYWSKIFKRSPSWSLLLFFLKTIVLHNMI